MGKLLCGGHGRHTHLLGRSLLGDDPAGFQLRGFGGIDLLDQGSEGSLLLELLRHLHLRLLAGLEGLGRIGLEGLDSTLVDDREMVEEQLLEDLAPDSIAEALLGILVEALPGGDLLLVLFGEADPVLQGILVALGEVQGGKHQLLILDGVAGNVGLGDPLLEPGQPGLEEVVPFLQAIQEGLLEGLLVSGDLTEHFADRLGLEVFLQIGTEVVQPLLDPLGLQAIQVFLGVGILGRLGDGHMGSDPVIEVFKLASKVRPTHHLPEGGLLLVRGAVGDDVFEELNRTLTIDILDHVGHRDRGKGELLPIIEVDLGELLEVIVGLQLGPPTLHGQSGVAENLIRGHPVEVLEDDGFGGFVPNLGIVIDPGLDGIEAGELVARDIPETIQIGNEVAGPIQEILLTLGQSPLEVQAVGPGLHRTVLDPGDEVLVVLEMREVEEEVVLLLRGEVLVQELFDLRNPLLEEAEVGDHHMLSLVLHGLVEAGRGFHDRGVVLEEALDIRILGVEMEDPAHMVVHEELALAVGGVEVPVLPILALAGLHMHLTVGLIVEHDGPEVALAQIADCLVLLGGAPVRTTGEELGGLDLEDPIHLPGPFVVDQLGAPDFPIALLVGEVVPVVLGDLEELRQAAVLVEVRGELHLLHLGAGLQPRKGEEGVPEFGGGEPIEPVPADAPKKPGRIVTVAGGVQFPNALDFTVRGILCFLEESDFRGIHPGPPRSGLLSRLNLPRF